MPGGALEGVTVIELSHAVSGPYCAKLFADYGADVIKVEPPGGDVARHWGPFPNDAPHPEKSGTFFFLNTNKRGVTLDVTTSRGRDAVSPTRAPGRCVDREQPRRARCATGESTMPPSPR